MTFIPPAPWHLRGVALCLPDVSRGVAALCLVRYDESPVGPYRELARARLTKRGPHVYEMPVTLERSCIGGRQIWGYPKSLDDMTWTDGHAGRMEFRRGAKVWRACAFGPRFPVALRAFTAQNLNGQNVRVPFATRGRARLAWCGRRLGAIVEFELTVDAPVFNEPTASATG